MRKSTANAIKTLLVMDTSVTRDERMAVIAAVRGAKPLPDAAQDMSVADAAEYLGLSRVTLWRMCKAGRVACDRRGKKYFIKAAAIAALKSMEVAA